MQYVDITNSQTPFDEGLIKRLGFKKSLNAPTDVEMVDREYHGPKRFLILASNKNGILPALKHKGALGVLVDGEEMDQKILSKIKDAGGAVVLNSYYLTVGQRDRISKIHRYRKLFRMAHRAGMRTAIVSMAPNEDYLLSSMQLLEIAKMITGDDHHAKLMLSAMGDML